MAELTRDAGAAVAMGAQLATSAARFGWYYGINRLVGYETRKRGSQTHFRPKGPIPRRQELMGELASLLLADADAVRQGIYPPLSANTGEAMRHLGRLRAMLDDLPAALARRAAAEADSVRRQANAAELPAYYVQDFHYQTGGYLSDLSAQLYDVQVETLFYGAANAMRRAALAPIARAIMGRDQRRLALLDVACGTGRFLRQARLAWPALGLAGIDLSKPYLAEADRHMRGLRSAQLRQANAEAMPFADASQDIVTAIFLFHELPGEVRRRVAREIARVLRPGGVMVLVDSLQMGDRPGWDGLLEAFPVRFHEPYFRGYVVDDLDALLGAAGLAAESRSLAFLSKVMVRRKSRDGGSTPVGA